MLKFKTFDELLENEGLKKKSAKSGISYGTLKKVYNRGMAAWRTGHRPGTTPQQWGMARVNSYIGKGKGTYYGADSDLSGKGKKKSNKESVSEASLSVKDAAGGMTASDKKRHSDMVARHGAKTKFSGSDVSYHGTDSQIQKALHIHHPDKDDKNRSLKYHKSGQHGKDHGSGATHTYNEARVTSTAFRAKTSMVNPMVKKNISDMGKKFKGNTSGFMNAVKKKYPDEHKSDIVKNMYKKHAETNEATVKEISKGTLSRYVKAADADKSKKHVRADVGKISRDDAYKNQVKRNRGITMAKSKMNPVKVKATEANVQEISKNLAKRYMGKASRDMYHKGQQQGTADAISRLGGPDQDYKKSPERKAAMRVRGMDRATNRLMKKEAMSDAEKAAHQKAIDAFKAKGGKVKKLKPGYAAGYHGKADPGAGIKGMISKDDTKDFGTKKKVRSMK